ncbi:RDD family protein [Nocardioides sp. W7]|uniref:RDD family protein n=1 Tax=Nocardioides sp. W7 TaxID=2931390 RepID=UPI001FD14857|nr:RDD family protein [Nocardioides sp. W7]
MVLPVAGLERRCYAFALDRLLSWTVLAGGVACSAVTLLRPGHTGAGIALIVGVALLVGVGQVVLLGRLGTTPGRAAVGLRVLDAETGSPIGVGRGLVRTLLLALATLPTFGLGVAMLAWTALTDPGGRRRGWHDRRVRSVVVDARPLPVAEVEDEPVPVGVVNLTALRLGPPASRSSGPPAPSRGPVSSAASSAPWRVDFDTGESFVVTGLTLVGRDPEARPGEQARLVPLPSEDQSLSKTHAQFQVAPDGALVVLDRGSTNGSVLARGGVPRQLSEHRPATLLPGDLVRFGDRTMAVAREE